MQIGQPARAAVAPTAASFDSLGYANALMGVDPKQGMAALASIKTANAPIKLGAGETLLAPNTYKPLYTNPKEQVQPAALIEYEYAKKQGYPGTFEQFTIQQKRAGASNNTISIAGPENTYNADIGKGLAATGLAQVDLAKNAPDVVRNSQMIRMAIQNGAITGTGADMRNSIQRAFETAGLLGKGRAASTEELMAGLNKMTLAGVKSSGLGAGQGFTDGDREFLAAASSGTIAMTSENLIRSADLAEKVARSNYDKGATVLQRWQGNPS